MSFTEALFALMPLQALAAAGVLLTLIGARGISPAGRWAQAGLLAVGLGLTLLSPGVQQASGLPALAQALGLAGVSLGLAALWWAFSGWLCPSARRPGLWAWALAPAVMLLVNGIFATRPAMARALSDALLAVQLAALALRLARHGRHEVLKGLNNRRWRLLGLAAVLPLGAAVLLRLIVGAAGTASPGVDLAVALAAQLALLLALPILLLAWRAEIEAELARLAHTDGLTGLVDRDAFRERSVDLLSLARRYQEPLALVVLELDGLDALREAEGADAADRALAVFGASVRAQMRLGDLAGRLSGERFAVLMGRCLPEGPQALGERLRADLAVRAPADLGQPLGFSAGWAQLRPGDRGLPDLQQRADTALYEARQAGPGTLMAEPGLST